MGEMADGDFYADLAIESIRREERRERAVAELEKNLDGVAWMTNEGDILLVEDMGQGHARNALDWLIRNHANRLGGEERIRESVLGRALTARANEVTFP